MNQLIVGLLRTVDTHGMEVELVLRPGMSVNKTRRIQPARWKHSLVVYVGRAGLAEMLLLATTTGQQLSNNI